MSINKIYFYPVLSSTWSVENVSVLFINLFLIRVAGEAERSDDGIE